MSLESLSEKVAVMPLGEAVRRTFPGITLDESRAADVRHGRAIPLELAAGTEGVLGAFDDAGEVLALLEPRAESLRVVVGFSG